MGKASGGKKQSRLQAAKLARKLDKARAAKQQAERKVGKLHVRLERAKAVLLKRTHRVDALEGRGTAQEAPVSLPAGDSSALSALIPDTPADGNVSLSPVDVSPVSAHDGVAAREEPRQ
jgi:hypothetical protein